MRAIELALAGKSKVKPKKERPFKSKGIIMDWDRKELYERIDKRVDKMMERGLLEEAKGLYKYRDLNALQTVGYKELFDYFDGVNDLDTAVEMIKRNTRRYAKRQLTWFKNQTDFRLEKTNSSTRIIEKLERKLEK